MTRQNLKDKFSKTFYLIKMEVLLCGGPSLLFSFFPFFLWTNWRKSSNLLLSSCGGFVDAAWWFRRFGWFLIGVEENLSSFPKVGVKYSFIQGACAWHNKILSKFDPHLTTWSKWSHPLPAVYYTIPNNHTKIPTPVKRKVAFIVQQSLSIQKK